MAPFDPFRILDLERTATSNEIKARYHELARRYHPNRNQAPDEASASLAEHFHQIHQAWQLLSEPESRRRNVEILELYDLQQSVLATFADLTYSSDQIGRPAPTRRRSNNSVSESDSDDDRSLHKSSRSARPSPASSADGQLDAIPEDDTERSDDYDSTIANDNSEGCRDPAAVRREKHERLRRAELEAFYKYQAAVLGRLEAEEDERASKEHYEMAKWRREYFDRKPKEAKQRVQLAQLISNAAKVFMSQRPNRKRNGSIFELESPATPITPITPSRRGTFDDQFLAPLQRTKTMHRRNFSKDLSVDQDSDDDTDYLSDRLASPSRIPRAPSPRRDYNRHHKSEPTLLPDTMRHFRPARPSVDIMRHDSLPNGIYAPISPISGPVKVSVKHVSNLRETVGSCGSDADTASASSRSTSPQVSPGFSPQFMLVPGATISDIFGRRQCCTKSTSVDGAVSRQSTIPVGHRESSGQCDFSIKQIGRLQHFNIPIDHVHSLNYQEKLWMLSIEPDADVDPRELIERLNGLDHSVAQNFMIKPDIKASFNFRLIYNGSNVVKRRGQTFIALSYRRKLQVEKKGKHYTLPLEPEMFQAVWDERISETESIWIDQICIDGESEEEKTISMSAMDMVYRSARLVVVALDDIQLGHQEGATLATHMERYSQMPQIPPHKRFRRRQTPYLETHDDLYAVLRKLLSSSWFRRAWCRHEMRLAREHIFLVPCMDLGGSRSVIRFSGKCFTHFLGLATEVPFHQSIEVVKPALYAFFRDRSKLSSHEHRLQLHHGNFTTVVADVFAMEAGGDPRIPEAQRASDARKDQISIVLNTMECGLALRPEMRNPSIAFTMARCQHMMLILALAARDPGALSSVGRPLLQLPDAPTATHITSTWLFEPTNVDSGLNNHKTLNRLDPSTQIITVEKDGHHYVELDLKFVKPGKVLHPLQSPETLELARKLMVFCEEHKLGRNRKRYLINDRTANHLFGSMREIYIETLVCVLECGTDWLSDICERYGVSRWRQDLQGACELMIALQNTYGRWPETAWNHQAVSFIMDVINFLIIRGMPQRQVTKPEIWRPIWVEHISGGRVLTFVPTGNVRAAIPAALLDSSYIHLARLWMLEPRDDYDEDTLPHHSEWTLLGKSVLFTDDAAIDRLSSQEDLIRSHQKVFGRPFT